MIDRLADDGLGMASQLLAEGCLLLQQGPLCRMLRQHAKQCTCTPIRRHPSAPTPHPSQVRASLLSILDSLPQGALFGLVTFSDRIGLWDVRGARDVMDGWVDQGWVCWAGPLRV